MKAILPLLPFVAALSLIACQGNDGPVAKGATAPPDNVIGDSGAAGLGSPANAAAAEASRRAAAPMADNGLGWSVHDQTASYGAVGAPAMLTIVCATAGGARHLIVTRFYPAHAGTTGTLSLTGSGHASSLPMHAVAQPGGPGESNWQGEASGDMGRAVAKAFGGQGVVNVTLGGAPALAIPTSPAVSAMANRCA